MKSSLLLDFIKTLLFVSKDHMVTWWWWSERLIHWTNGLTSQNSFQNLQDRLGCGSMEGEPTATVRLPEGQGVPQHLPENQDLTWSPWQQPRVSGKKRFLNKRNLHGSLPASWGLAVLTHSCWPSEEQTKHTTLCNTEGISSLPCSMAATTLRFSSVAAAKLTAGSRGSTGQSAGFHQIIIISI